jgi:hypothetical protein
MRLPFSHHLPNKSFFTKENCTMKTTLSKINNATLKICAALSVGTYSLQAFAQTAFDPSEDLSGGLKASTVIENTSNLSRQGAGLLFDLVGIAGFVICALCLAGLYRASKDEQSREQPVGLMIGLVIGVLMSAVGAVSWAIRNELLGS